MDEVTIEDQTTELPSSRRMKVGEHLGLIQLPGARLPASVLRGAACFELRSPVQNKVFGTFYDDGRDPDLPSFWGSESRKLVIQQFHALVEKYDRGYRYTQLSRYESTEAEREAIRRFLDWLGEQPTNLLEQRPFKPWWLLKHHLTLAVHSASSDEIQGLVLEAVGIDAVQLAAERQDIERRRAESPS